MLIIQKCLRNLFYRELFQINSFVPGCTPEYNERFTVGQLPDGQLIYVDTDAQPNRMIYDYYITYYAISKREYRDLFEMAKEAGYLKSAGKNGNPTLKALGKD